MRRVERPEPNSSHKEIVGSCMWSCIKNKLFFNFFTEFLYAFLGGSIQYPIHALAYIIKLPELPANNSLLAMTIIHT